MDRYKSDEDIAIEYQDAHIREFKAYSENSGYLDIVFPNGAEDRVDNWIKYDNGIIAFDHWYPSNIYNNLVEYINEKLTNINNV